MTIVANAFEMVTTRCDFKKKKRKYGVDQI